MASFKLITCLEREREKVRERETGDTFLHIFQSVMWAMCTFIKTTSRLIIYEYVYTTSLYIENSYL